MAKCVSREYTKSYEIYSASDSDFLLSSINLSLLLLYYR